MKKLPLTLLLYGFSATVFANTIALDVMYDSGSSVQLDWWMYPIVLAGSLAFYAAAGWVVYKCGKFWYLGLIAILAAMAVFQKVVMNNDPIIALGLFLPVLLAAFGFSMNQPEDPEVKRKRIEESSAEFRRLRRGTPIK